MAAPLRRLGGAVRPGHRHLGAAANLAQARGGHTATLLPNGKVLVAGGGNNSSGIPIPTAELYEDSGTNDAWRPVLSAFSPGIRLAPGATLSVTGSRFRGISEGGSGSSSASPADFPLLRLMNLESRQVLDLPLQGFSATAFTTTLPNLPFGHYLLTATVNASTGGQVIPLAELTPPDTTVTSAPAEVDSSSSASFRFTATKPGSTFECRLDTGAFSACQSPRTYAGLADGPHTFQVRATDPSGNVDPTPASVPWRVDTVSETPVITAPAEGAHIALGALVVSGTAEANSKVQVSLDDAHLGNATAGADGTWSLSPSAPVASGPHTLRATAIDVAGNTSRLSAAVSFVQQSSCGCSSAGGPWIWLAALVLPLLRVRRSARVKLLFLAMALGASTALAATAPEDATSPLALHADLFASDVQPVNLKLTGGTRWAYLMLQAGAGRAGQFVAGAGLGVHGGERLWADVDATCSIIQALTGAQETDLLMQLRLSIGVQVHPNLAFFLGPTLNSALIRAERDHSRSALAPLAVLAPAEGGGGWQFWAGLHAGIRL